MIIDAVNKTARKANVDKWPDQYVMVFETSSKGDLVFLNALNELGMKWMSVL